MSKLAVILLLHINGLVNFFISFDLSIDNATKFCNEDGTWDKTAYDNCLNTVSHPVPTHDVEYNTYIYCIGYLLSIVVLSIAVIIFVTFKWVSFFISPPIRLLTRKYIESMFDIIFICKNMKQEVEKFQVCEWNKKVFFLLFWIKFQPLIIIKRSKDFCCIMKKMSTICCVLKKIILEIVKIKQK